MKWHTENRFLRDLKVLASNPRKITDENFNALKSDIEGIGNFKPLIADIDNTVLAGNQRFRYLLAKYGGEYEVEVSFPERKLTEEERKKVTILDNRHRGEDDIEILAREYDETLAELGFPQFADINVDELWKGMPEYVQEDKTSYRDLIVHFADEEGLQSFFDIIGQSHTEATKYIWFPEQEGNHPSQKKYE